MRARGRDLDIRLRQNLRLSRVAHRAVRNGVPLVLTLQLEVRDSQTLTLVAAEERRFEVSYLPMSERFQLTDTTTGRVDIFPRLRHVLAELGSVRLTIDAAPLAPGDYELRSRIRLDRGSLPAPMQLPSYVSRAWRHDSDWTQWPFRISA